MSTDSRRSRAEVYLTRAGSRLDERLPRCASREMYRKSSTPPARLPSSTVRLRARRTGAPGGSWSLHATPVATPVATLTTPSRDPPAARPTCPDAARRQGLPRPRPRPRPPRRTSGHSRRARRRDDEHRRPRPESRPIRLTGARRRSGTTVPTPRAAVGGGSPRRGPHHRTGRSRRRSRGRRRPLRRDRRRPRSPHDRARRRPAHEPRTRDGDARDHRRRARRRRRPGRDDRPGRSRARSLQPVVVPALGSPCRAELRRPPQPARDGSGDPAATPARLTWLSRARRPGASSAAAASPRCASGRRATR